ncbi:porin family protein [Pedobacter steynii]|uniref:Outer membrane protein beta-barrel domain-containing protein n=1 Tax=Pedobacter steynii TaxID=430522 RepID=A0A1D7QLY7_9SPHI|nr:porin family protein [Pedobacter steynii]AOM79677.1 hypothetical protein BFS30_22465 [Pedobacter steynii]
MTIKKLRYILTVLTVMYASTAIAQLNIGVDAGISYNKLQVEMADDEIRLSKNSGYIVNVNIDQKINKWLAIEVSPGLIQKNYRVENKNNIYQNVTNTYLHLPITAKYEMKVLKKINLSAALGAYYAYWIESTMEGVAPNVFELSTNPEGNETVRLERIKSNYRFNAKQDNRSEFGWVAKIGLDYRVLKNVSATIKGHFYQSITDQQKRVSEIHAQKYNQTTALTIGGVYHFQ